MREPPRQLKIYREEEILFWNKSVLFHKIHLGRRCYCDKSRIWPANSPQESNLCLESTPEVKMSDSEEERKWVLRPFFTSFLNFILRLNFLNFILARTRPTLRRRTTPGRPRGSLTSTPTMTTTTRTTTQRRTPRRRRRRRTTTRWTSIFLWPKAFFMTFNYPLSSFPRERYILALAWKVAHF